MENNNNNNQQNANTAPARPSNHIVRAVTVENGDTPINHNATAHNPEVRVVSQEAVIVGNAPMQRTYGYDPRIFPTLEAYNDFVMQMNGQGSDLNDH